MGGHIAVPDTPLDGRIRKDEAVFARGEFCDFLAAFTLLDYGMTVTAVELAAFLAHEEALNTLFYGLTNHGYHILSSEF